MIKYEYTIRFYDSTHPQFIDNMTEMGNAGWDNYAVTGHTFYFKRVKIELPKAPEPVVEPNRATINRKMK